MLIESTVKIGDIKETLDLHVLGQESAKEELSKAFWLHMYQTFTEKKHGKIPRKQYMHPHLLLTGPTGSGKTEMVTALSEEYFWPLITIDMSVVTPSGYVGTTLSEIIYNEVVRLIEDSVNNVENVIIFCDEFDKIVGEDGGDRDVRAFKKSVQYEFLKLIETGILDTGENGSSKTKKEVVDLSRAMFIMAGNFPDMRKDNIKSGIGFDRELKEDLNAGLSAVEKLTKVGMATQLAGRISFIGELERLTEEQLTDIVNGENLVATGIYKLAQEAKVTVTDDMKNFAVKHALKTNTGARGLKLPLIKSILDKLYRQDVYINFAKFSGAKKLEELESRYVKLVNENTYINTFLVAWNRQLGVLKREKNNLKSGSPELRQAVIEINELTGKLDELQEEYNENKKLIESIKKEIQTERDKLKKKSILGK